MFVFSKITNVMKLVRKIQDMFYVKIISYRVFKVQEKPERFIHFTKIVAFNLEFLHNLSFNLIFLSLSQPQHPAPSVFPEDEQAL